MTEPMAHLVDGPADAPVLLLLHGFPFAGDMWDDVRPLLGSQVRVIVPDLLAGAHRSGEPSIDRLSDGVIGILDRLGVERAVVVGLSMGGYVALSVARDHSDRVAGLGLLNTRSAPDTEEGRAGRVALAEQMTREESTRSLVETMPAALLGETTRRERPDVVRRLEGLLAAPDPRDVAWGSLAMAARPDTTPVLAKVDVPTLVLTADEDTLIPPSFSEAMAAALKNGSAPTTYVVVPGAGHMSAMERPEPVAAALRDLVSASEK
ncbi:MAG TPA: alpha/beta hydrolase [Actinomycetes bacterium]|nr:alpha/beta hydrolase [Actinomycetes bacterium]